MQRLLKLRKLPQQQFSSQVEIFINDQAYQVDPSLTVFQACQQQGITIPRFCFHEKLSVSGNCRMCLVEVEKAPKPVASCSAQIMPGMRIHTDSETTRIARGGVMEFLLANHPLDCPICDQGGECDLQDISDEYGYGVGRYDEFKRAVEDKNIGPVVSTVMNRCIHCTRCVRFSQEVAGVWDLGTFGRGRATEVGTYIEKMVTSELSGNLVDLCPVGALTNQAYSFTSRPWELLRTNSVDLMEGIVPLVEFDSRGTEVMRVLPRIHEEVNEEWISDKSRFSYDGLKRQRLAFPLVRREGGVMEEVQWDTAMGLFRQALDRRALAEDLVGFVGEFISAESLTVFRDFMHKLDCEDFACHNYHFRGRQREDFLLNRTVAEFEELDALVLVGCDPKLEAPVLNARILKSVRHNGLKVFKIGAPDNLNYEYTHVGNDTSALNELLKGKGRLYEALKQHQNVHFMVSSQLQDQSPNADRIFQNLKSTCQNLNAESPGKFFTAGVLHNHVGQVNAYELGFQFRDAPQLRGKKMVINFGNDNKGFLEEFYGQQESRPFTVYLGTHGDEGARYADLVLPVSAWTEEQGTFLSTEGRNQFAPMVVKPPGLAKDGWFLFRVLAEELGYQLQYDTLEEVRSRMAELSPALMKYDYIESYGLYEKDLGRELQTEMLGSTVDNFYKTDSVSRSSLVLSKCSAAFNKSRMSNFKERTIRR